MTLMINVERRLSLPPQPPTPQVTLNSNKNQRPVYSVHAEINIRRLSLSLKIPTALNIYTYTVVSE